jgi:hypothetical protein
MSTQLLALSSPEISLSWLKFPAGNEKESAHLLCKLEVRFYDDDGLALFKTQRLKRGQGYDPYPQTGKNPAEAVRLPAGR